MYSSNWEELSYSNCPQFITLSLSDKGEVLSPLPPCQVSWHTITYLILSKRFLETPYWWNNERSYWYQHCLIFFSLWNLPYQHVNSHYSLRTVKKHLVQKIHENPQDIRLIAQKLMDYRFKNMNKFLQYDTAILLFPLSPLLGGYLFTSIWDIKYKIDL